MRRLTSCLILFFFSSVARAQDHAALPTIGAHDTILVPIVYYNGEWLPYAQMDVVYISTLPPHKLAKHMEEYNRLRRVVYLTYPYARRASVIINDVNTHLKDVSSKKERKKYIRSRESELKKQFADPISNLTVYQGKVLMKLIYRETGDDCYEIIREFRGGLNARMYQTVAFFFGGNLKQKYDPVNDALDREIESILKEWYGVRYQPPPVHH